MNICKIVALATVGIVVLIEPVFAIPATPGPIAGVGLPALAIVGGAYWLGRKLFGHKR